MYFHIIVEPYAMYLTVHLIDIEKWNVLVNKLQQSEPLQCYLKKNTDSQIFKHVIHMKLF